MREYSHLRRLFVVWNVWLVETIRLCRHACIFLMPDQGVMQLGEPLTRWLHVYYMGVVQQTSVRVKCLVTAQYLRKKGCLIVENVWWSSQASPRGPRCMCQSVGRPLLASDCQVTSISCSSCELPCRDKWTPTQNGDSRESVSCHII
jgi:hypothetical protein